MRETGKFQISLAVGLIIEKKGGKKPFLKRNSFALNEEGKDSAGPKECEKRYELDTKGRMV